MEFLNRITTQFVRDRINETAWGNRAYAAHLYQLESILKRNGPHSVVEAMLLAGLRSRYPIECACIEKELKRGELTCPEEFARLQKEHDRRLVEEFLDEMQQRFNNEEGLFRRSP